MKQPTMLDKLKAAALDPLAKSWGGTIGTVSLAPEHWISLLVAVPTAVYTLYKIYDLYDKRRRRKEQNENR